MFLQVWPSGSSHEEAHLERGERRATPQSGGKKKFWKGERKEKKCKQTPPPDQSLGWTVPEQGGGRVFQPKHAVLHHTETQCLRDLSSEKGALKVVYCNKRTKSWMGKFFFVGFFLFVFFLDWEGLKTHTDTHKKTKLNKKNRRNKKKRQLKSEWFVRMVHDVLGTSPRQQIHWYFTKLSEASMCALWMSVIGYRTPLLPIWKREERKRRILGGRRDGIGGWAGTDVAVDWAFWEKHSACVSLVAVWGWGREEAPACLPALCGNQTWVREGGPPCFSEASEALGLTRASDKERERGADMSPSGLCNLGTKTPPYTPPLSWSLYDRSFFWCFWCSY